MKSLPELDELLNLEKLNAPLVHFETLNSITSKGESYPIKSIVIGSQDKSRPTFGLFGGVHGLERVGTQVIISFFHTLLHQLKWDKDLCSVMENYRIVSIPIVNPGGMAASSRCNPNNVDLMRNAPVEAEGKVPFMVSGHRFSSKLPWYRGVAGVMETEAQTLVDFVKAEMYPSSMSIALDVHSGFGVRDQLWYPYAKTKAPFPKLEEVLQLKKLLDQTYPNHIYKVEAQSANYTTHGDLWDYIFDDHDKNQDQNSKLFLPLTLELGSWNWVRKNPLQTFSKLGFFHPIKGHRHARIMRRHILLLDFLVRAVRNKSSWLGN